MDRSWLAAIAMFQLPVLAGKQDVVFSYVDQARQAIDWPGLDAAMTGWSHGEHVLVRVAHALFDGGDIAIHELGVLSPEVTQAVLQIIARRFW